MALSKVRDIDSKFKDIVFYYIGQYEKENKQSTVPMMLKYLCLHFYLIQERFVGLPKSQMIINNETDTSHALEIVGNSETININDTSISKYIWKLKVLSTAVRSGWGHIGLWSTKLEPAITVPKEYWRPYLFGLEVYRRYYFSGKELKKPAVGDEIEIILDIQHRKLVFRMNGDNDIMGEFLNMEYWKEDEEWINQMGLRLGIRLPFKFSYQLTSFSIEQK